MTAVAVNDTLLPAQMVVFDAEMLTDGATGLSTWMVFGAEVTIVPLLQVDVLITDTVIWSLLFSVVDVKVLLFVPALIPFTFH